MDQLALFLSWLMLSAGCWLAAEVIDGFEMPAVASGAAVAAFLGLINAFLGWVAHGMVSDYWGFWLRPPLAFLLRFALDAALFPLLGYLLPRVLRLRHFGIALLAALVASAFGTAGEVVVEVILWLPRQMLRH